MHAFHSGHCLPVSKTEASARLCLPYRYIKAAGAHNLLNDAAIVSAIAIFWAASGQLNAGAYVKATAWAPPGAKERAGGLMALTFQVGCLLSLLCATAVQHFCFSLAL